MKLIIGLGNPGPEYVDTRHNAGYKLVDSLQTKKLPKGFIVKKSDVFMNESGKFVDESIHRSRAQLKDLYVVHDDLDIPLGSYKIQFGKGPKDHNGIKSIDEALGSNDYWHVRVGIDNRPLDNRPMGEEYVLQNFTEEEKLVLDKTIREICRKLVT